jgi:galactose-1-phosphate uridylyltransferase
MSKVNISESWNADVAHNQLEAIRKENPERNGDFHRYGMFHKWKAEDTNFLDVATEFLNPDHGNKHSECYLEAVEEVVNAWNCFAINYLPGRHWLQLSERWKDQEEKKVARWLKKNGFAD